VSVAKKTYCDWQSGKVVGFKGDDELTGHALAGAKRMATFKARCKGLERFASDNGLTVYFLTLTLKSDSGEMRMLNRFLNWLRARFKRHGMKIGYLWVLEPQEKRYERTGILARHWHIAIACAMGALPNVEYLPNAVKHYHMISDGSVVKEAELHKYWGFGQELCSLAQRSLSDYLGKYMEKNLKELLDLGRRFGSSMLLWWRISRWAYEVVREFWAAGLDVLKVWFTRGDAARLLHFKVTDGVTMEFYTIPSPWRRVESASVDA
jgi:hypothetical protein